MANRSDLNVALSLADVDRPGSGIILRMKQAVAQREVRDRPLLGGCCWPVRQKTWHPYNQGFALLSQFQTISTLGRFVNQVFGQVGKTVRR
jgi:hypothetical protein